MFIKRRYFHKFIRKSFGDLIYSPYFFIVTEILIDNYDLCIKDGNQRGGSHT